VNRRNGEERKEHSFYPLINDSSIREAKGQIVSAHGEHCRLM
jgi:hypothetical protein